MMTITVVMVIGGVVIIMMMGVRMRGMDTEDNVQTFFGMHVMKMDVCVCHNLSCFHQVCGGHPQSHPTHWGLKAYGSSVEPAQPLR